MLHIKYQILLVLSTVAVQTGWSQSDLHSRATWQENPITWYHNTVTPHDNPTTVYDRSATPHDTSVIWYGWTIVNTYPHDTEAFTQGLLFHDGYLYESTGRRGKSEIRKVDLETGTVLHKAALDSAYFGEGLALWKDQLVQLTLSSGKGLVYDLNTFEPIQTFSYEGEGWGLSQTESFLVMSDGTETLTFLDPDTYQARRSVRVTANGKPVDNLNELEMIDGVLYANVLFEDQIILINPEDGVVTGRVDLSRLVRYAERNGRLNVLNGIAYDSVNNRLFVTGKLWPELYEIELIPLH